MKGHSAPSKNFCERFGLSVLEGLYCELMRKRTEQEQDAEVLKRLERHAPEVLEARIDFDALVSRILDKPQATKSKKRHKKD